MEKLTPVKFSQVRDITGTKNGKAYSFHSVGFTTREYGDQKWYNIAFNDKCPLVEGRTYDVQVTERPYLAKDNSQKIAYDVKLPSELDKLLMSLEQRLGRLETAFKEFQVQKKEVPEIPIINGEDGPLPPPPGDDDWLG